MISAFKLSEHVKHLTTLCPTAPLPLRRQLPALPEGLQDAVAVWVEVYDFEGGVLVLGVELTLYFPVNPLPKLVELQVIDLLGAPVQGVRTEVGDAVDEEIGGVEDGGEELELKKLLLTPPLLDALMQQNRAALLILLVDVGGGEGQGVVLVALLQINLSFVIVKFGA